MNEAEHKERHEELHGALDELAADFLTHNKDAMLDDTILRLMQWSHQQTIEPDEDVHENT